MLAASTISAAPIVAAMAFGVVVAIAGHASRLRWLVLTGLAILFLATAGMLLSGLVAYHQDSSDPRKERDPTEAHF
jgi:4-hydroxybenzoate polyprenyltransferase